MPRSSFDMAALLRRGGEPACAAVLDVYGPDVAELFVVATRRWGWGGALCFGVVAFSPPAFTLIQHTL
jgi:hypothetical protein